MPSICFRGVGADEEWDYTFRLNVGAYFYLVKVALPHMSAGAALSAAPWSTPTCRLRLCALRRDQGGHRQSVRQSGAIAGGEGHSG